MFFDVARPGGAYARSQPFFSRCGARRGVQLEGAPGTIAVAAEARTGETAAWQLYASHQPAPRTTVVEPITAVETRS